MSGKRGYIYITLNLNPGGFPMKHSFYDVKTKKKVQAEVTKAVKYGKGTATRYAFKALTKDGRNLTAFVSKADWDKFKK